MCMTNKLQTYFPMIQSRREVLAKIYQREDLLDTFDTWTSEQQNEFLDFCSGARGVKILYDGFFKEIFNPESTPERLEELLSFLLKQQVKIISILPNDSTRLAQESALLIMDIVVETETGVANIEIQKFGYNFPGQRSACYSADLLLRQYKRVRSQKKKNFRYKDIKSVYTIVLFENSPKEFHSHPNSYIHHFEQKSDSGLELDLLQKFIFIPLDTFRNSVHNNSINCKLDAWLAFLSMDDPDTIITLIQTYPEFRDIYSQIYDICQNVEDIMGIFSKELRIMDQNEIPFMIDEMKEEINQHKHEILQQKKELAQLNMRIDDANKELDHANKELDHANKELDHANRALAEKDALYQHALARIQELENQTV